MGSKGTYGRIDPKSVIEGLTSTSRLDHVELKGLGQHRPERLASPSVLEELHEFLFFVKPELLSGREEDVSRRLTVVLDQLKRFDLDIVHASILTGRFLGTRRIVSEHYGVIDRIARSPRAFLSEAGRNRFSEVFGKPFDEANVVGAIEYLRVRPDLSPAKLAEEWLASPYEKLAPGSYCVRLPDESLYLFNGFYPKLLKHYTRKSARILVLVLQGRLGWSRARRELIGATDPEEAVAGSLRRVLYERQESLRLEEVSVNLNGAHLSAGPLEALVELRRFIASSEEGGSDMDDYRRFLFGRLLGRHFDDATVAEMLRNPEVEFDEEHISLFDLTEELDSSDAVTRLKTVEEQIGVPVG